MKLFIVVASVSSDISHKSKVASIKALAVQPYHFVKNLIETHLNVKRSDIRRSLQLNMNKQPYFPVTTKQ